MEVTSRGSYYWPVTSAEMNETISCQFGGVLGSSVGPVVRRQCDPRGDWIESNLTECASFSESTLRNISMVSCTLIK